MNRDDTGSVAESLQWNLLAQQDPEIVQGLVSTMNQSEMSVLDSELALNTARTYGRQQSKLNTTSFQSSFNGIMPEKSGPIDIDVYEIEDRLEMFEETI